MYFLIHRQFVQFWHKLNFYLYSFFCIPKQNFHEITLGHYYSHGLNIIPPNPVKRKILFISLERYINMFLIRLLSHFFTTLTHILFSHKHSIHGMFLILGINHTSPILPIKVIQSNDATPKISMHYCRIQQIPFAIRSFAC